jgi:hypothetical protein
VRKITCFRFLDAIKVSLIFNAAGYHDNVPLPLTIIAA